MGQKLWEKLSIRAKNLPILKNKKDFLGQKKQAGAELKNKIRIFWAKSWGKKEYNGQTLTNLKKKKRLFGLILSRKKFENKVQKLTNFQEKKAFVGPKNKLGLSLI